MTAAAPADHAAASRLVAALEHAWTAIRSHHPDVAQVVIVVASGSDPRSRRLNLGHFAAGRWQLTNPDTPTNRAEVLVSGEGLHRGPVDVLGTLLHEAAHGLAHARKISDTSRQGRYHNRRYAALARELGLDVTHAQPIGWSATSVPESTAARYVEVLAELAEALVLWRRAELASPAGSGEFVVDPNRRVEDACSHQRGGRMGVADGVAASGPILRELFLRHGVSVHHLRVHHAGRLRSMPGGARLPRRLGHGR